MEEEVISYEEFCERQYREDGWWDWMIEDRVSQAKLIGLDFDDDAIYFDIYHNTCYNSGHVVNKTEFVKEYFDRLMRISPLLTEMLKYDMVSFRWTHSRNGYIQHGEYDDYHHWGHTEEFTEGLFVGTSVESLYDAESEEVKNDFADELLKIVDEYNQETLAWLKGEDEWRVSQEAYEEFLTQEQAEREWEQMRKLKPLQICGAFP